MYRWDEQLSIYSKYFWGDIQNINCAVGTSISKWPHIIANVKTMESGTKCTTLLINAISKELSKGKDKTQLPYVSCHRLLCLFLLSFWPSHQSVHFYIDLYFTVTHLKDKPFFFFPKRLDNIFYVIIMICIPVKSGQLSL